MAPFLAGAKLGHQSLEDIGVLRRVFEPGEEVERLAKVAGVVQAARDRRQVRHRHGDVARSLLEDGAPLILGCTLAQNKFEGRAPKGFVLVRAFLGGVQSDWVGENDERLTERVFAELKEFLGITGKPMFTQLERYDRALWTASLDRLEQHLERRRNL